MGGLGGLLDILWASLGESEPPCGRSRATLRTTLVAKRRRSWFGRVSGHDFGEIFDARGHENVWFFLRRKHTFQKIDILHLKRDLGLFLSPFGPLGGASGSLLAPYWLSLTALGAPGSALGMSQGPTGTSPGAPWEAQGRCWRAFGHLKGSRGSWKPHFGVPAVDFRGFTTVFPCGGPYMIRATSRAAVCAKHLELNHQPKCQQVA